MTLETMSTYILRITLGLPKPAGMTPEETATWEKIAAGIAGAKGEGPDGHASEPVNHGTERWIDAPPRSRPAKPRRNPGPFFLARSGVRNFIACSRPRTRPLR